MPPCKVSREQNEHFQLGHQHNATNIANSSSPHTSIQTSDFGFKTRIGQHSPIRFKRQLSKSYDYNNCRAKDRAQVKRKQYKPSVLQDIKERTEDVVEISIQDFAVSSDHSTHLIQTSFVTTARNPVTSDDIADSEESDLLNKTLAKETPKKITKDAYPSSSSTDRIPETTGTLETTAFQDQRVHAVVHPPLVLVQYQLRI